MDLLNKFLDKIPTRRITASVPESCPILNFNHSAGQPRSAALDHPCAAYDYGGEQEKSGVCSGSYRSYHMMDISLIVHAQPFF